MSNSHDNKSNPSAAKSPDAATASQWLTDALNDAGRVSNNKGHVDYLKHLQSNGKIVVNVA